MAKATMMYFAGLGVEQNYQKMVEHLIKSVETFNPSFEWILEEEDDWLVYGGDAPGEFWDARELYWKAIRTGEEVYLSQLKQLKRKASPDGEIH